MPSFHFFTNSASLQPQTAQQSYGPVQGQEATKYRVTSLFSSSSSQKAYAICNGKIFAQEVDGRINLVLKPTRQPKGLLSPVKYYIYKGMKKDSLVDTSNTSRIADENKSDLTAKIHKSQKDRNEALDQLLDQPIGKTTTLPSISAVGLNLTASAVHPFTFADTAFLDDVFLRIDNDEFPTVDGGDDLGEFDPSGFGFEVMLDGFGERPRLDRIRASETLVSATSSGTNAASTFLEEDRREQILGYMDPCAFYVAFFFSGIGVKTSPTDKTFAVKSHAALYTEVLAKFWTKNVVYLDLRNEHNHGLNYYEEYGVAPGAKAQFSISYDGGANSLVEYTTNGWPIFIIPTNSFTNPDPKKPSTFSLMLPRGDNTSPIIYRTQGYFFSGFRRMSQPPDETEILRPNVPFVGDQTISIAFSIPKLPDNTTLPAYVSLRYLKSIGATPATSPPAASLALKANHFIDNLFELTYLLDVNGPRIPLNTNEIPRWHVTGATAVVDPSSHYGMPYVAKIGIGRDQSNVYVFACKELTPLATGSSKDSNFLPNLGKAYRTNIEFGYISLLDPSTVEQAVMTHDGLADGIIPPPDPSALNLDASSVVVLAFHNAELPAVLTAVNSMASALDKRLVLRNGQDYFDANGIIQGSEYDLFVTGYAIGTSVSVLSVNTSIKIRRSAGTPRIFSSRDAALALTKTRSIEQNRKHFARSRMQLDVDWGIHTIYQTGDANSATSKRIQWEMSVLGKKRVHDATDGRDYDWYLVETNQDIPTNSSNTVYRVLSKGSKRWVRADQDKFYSVASFEKFVTDLVALNTTLDVQQSQAGSQLDTLQERVTRLRQMTKELINDPDAFVKVSISKLFDEIIGASAATPPGVKRLDDIQYVAGVQEDLIDDFGSPQTVDTEIQLFRDYMGVEIGPSGAGVVIDLHHLFVGLDVLFHSDEDKLINPFVMFVSGISSGLDSLPPFYPLGNNIDMATWAGDIGAAPADFLSGSDPSYRKVLDDNPALTQEQRTASLLTHFYSTRAKDDDLLPDVYAHELYAQLLQHLQRDVSFRNLPAVLYYFNAQLANEGGRAAFNRFYSYLKLNTAKSFLEQHPASDDVAAGISAFANLWWIRDNPGTAVTAYLAGNPLIAAPAITPLVVVYAFQFLRWLEAHK
jgi:hypothetical protein